MSLKDILPLLLLVLPITILTDKAMAQNPSRLSNIEYTQTTFMEDFTTKSLDRDVWSVASNIIKSNLFILTDSSATVNQTERGLELSMLRSPGYTTKIWTPEGENTAEAEFIGGEVMTKKDFSYGIFECNATLAYGNGSFPAFWLYNDTMCTESERPETDVVELKAVNSKPTLDVGIWYYPKECLPQTHHEFSQFPFSWGDPHTFKGVWTPERIEFWVDDKLLKVVYNTGQYWYPYLPQHMVLSQQVVRSGTLFSGTNLITTPQTSWFHWVRVKEFFLAPEIYCPDNIWNTVVATMDVDNKAFGITWELIPTRLFAGKTSGRGLQAVITPATSFHATGKIIYRFSMPSGEKFTAEKTIRLNGLNDK